MQKSSKSHARFEVKAAGWDDKPFTRGITEKVKDWVVGQVCMYSRILDLWTHDRT